MGVVRERDLAAVLMRFPKTRPELPPKLQAIYTRQYVENRSGATPAASLSQRLERWLHHQVAADVKTGGPRSTLELGAGTLNQLAYEPASDAYDIVEPFEELFRDSPKRGRIREVFADAADVPADRRYDRITSVAALEHICDLPLVLARAARHLNADGSLRAAIPSEGGLLWKLGWMVTTGLEFPAAPRPRLRPDDGPRARQQGARHRTAAQRPLRRGRGQELRRGPPVLALPLHRRPQTPTRRRRRLGSPLQLVRDLRHGSGRSSAA
jgi:SAM-dependent methyltransferase